MSHNIEEILDQLREEATEEQKERVTDRGVEEENVLGAPKGVMRDLAKSLGRDQSLADELWKTKVHEARLLAVWVAEPEKQTLKSVKAWAKQVETWDLADQMARYLTSETEIRLEVIEEFTKSDDLYTKRIGFGTIACLMMNHPDQRSDVVENWLDVISQGAEDDRDHVSKAVLSALIEIGKVDEYWQDAAIVTACELQAEGPTAASLGYEAEKTLSELVSVGDRRRLISGNNSKAEKNQSSQSQNSKRRNGGGKSNSNNNNRRGGRGQQQGQQNSANSSDGKKPARRNGRNKRRSRTPAPKTV